MWDKCHSSAELAEEEVTEAKCSLYKRSELVRQKNGTGLFFFFLFYRIIYTMHNPEKTASCS